MTESISRKFYRQALLLYPEHFRHQFGEEMLGLFEECNAAQGSWRLIADLVFSAVRQRFRYLLTPAPKSTPLYAEIGASPDLARLLAIAVCATSLVTGVLAGTDRPKAPEPWTLIRPERRFWPAAGECRQYCFYPHAAPTEPRPRESGTHKPSSAI